MIQSQLVGTIFALVSTGILAYLFKTGKYSRRIGYVFLIIATVLGFVIFSPMFPIQFQQLIQGNQIQGVPVLLPIILLIGFIVLALVFGRLLCGYLCPIGTVQELAYSLPGKKYLKGHSGKTQIIRLIFLGAVILAALVLSMGLINILGPGSFFKVAYLTAGFWVFAAILALSVFVYRPFCRIACPYGVFLALGGSKSMFKLRRNDNCIDCGKCEKACPTGEAGRDDSKTECYMCNRCVEACPVNGLEYSRKAHGPKRKD